MPRTKFTKGNWKVLYVRDSNHPSVYSDLDGKSVLSSGHSRTRSINEQIANCVLASCAPTMFRLLEAIEHCPDRVFEGSFYLEIKDVVQQVLGS